MSINFEICKNCLKKIPKSEKIIHELNCKSLQNNIPKNNSINNIDKEDSFGYDNCKIGKQFENELHLILNMENSFNENLCQKEEESLNMIGILNSRNIQSNNSILPNINEFHTFSIDNRISFQESSSYNINANEILNNLIPIEINDDINARPKYDCIICLENYKNGESYIILPCIHSFHEECLKSWIKSKNKCPICSSEIKIND